jgi:hypothetical protein
LNTLLLLAVVAVAMADLGSMLVVVVLVDICQIELAKSLAVIAVRIPYCICRKVQQFTPKLRRVAQLRQ